MRSSLPRFLILVAASALLLSGCLNSTQIRGIAVQVAEVNATPVAGGGADVTVSIRYLNENLVAIAVSGTRHRLSLNGVSLGRIESNQPIGLTQMGNQVQDVTVRVDAATAARLREMQAAGTANYQLESTILISAGDEKMESRASGSGSVSLADLGL